MDDLPERRDAPTISQVARLAGVSRSSVSRAFSRPELLGAETLARIKAAARELAYVPNHTARALSTGRYGNVALIVPDVANPFFPPLIKAAQHRADQSDFCVFLGNSNEDAAQEDKLIERVAGQVEGLILVSSRLNEARIRAHAARHPLVLVNRDVSGLPRVLIDSARAVEDAVAHLVALGHEKILYVSGPQQSWSNRQRHAAVRRAALERGVAMETRHASVPNYETGRELGTAAAQAGQRAIIAFDDLIAQGVMAGIVAAGARVPDDVSVVGCDDVLAAATFPPLTTVSNRSAEAGRLAMSRLLDLLHRATADNARQVLGTDLVLRHSTGPATRSWSLRDKW